MKTLIILPAYHEAPVIRLVVEQIIQAGYTDVLVVDDASTDATAEEASKGGAMVIKHPINRGAGAATMTGLQYAGEQDYTYAVTMDADGQHAIDDLRALMQEAPHYDVVMGSRLRDFAKMPWSRRVANFIGSIVTWFFFGLFVRDSQSGFKVFNRKAISTITITFDRYEFCSEIIGEIYRHGLSWKEVPISVIYTEHSLKKGQSIANGFRMVMRFLFNR